LRRSIAGVLAMLTCGSARALEGSWSYAVQVSASVTESPGPRITLNWPTDTTSNYASPIPNSFTIYRKGVADNGWGLLTTTPLPGSTTSFTDSTVAVGTVYDYKVVKAYNGYNGYGYVRAAIKAPLVDNRGKVLLIVGLSPDQRASLAGELARLVQDLTGDGWTVVRRDVLPTDSVASVKKLITADYAADVANVRSVFLFGHVPVPYSGLLNPDGHDDHIGAWPADAYYGDMDGGWTDSTVNYRQTINTDSVDAERIGNRPGDGKFDQSVLPSSIELEVGRVDLANMPGNLPWDPPGTPVFPSETELLRRYLGKDHNFRHRLLNVQRRAIIYDRFWRSGRPGICRQWLSEFRPACWRGRNPEFERRVQ